MRYYVIAGEASGDLHGSNLIKALSGKDPSAQFRCWGGDLMQAAGGEIVKHYRDLAFMGFVEVVMNLRTIFANLAFCKEDIDSWKPDALVLIDYPGFNLRIAEWAHRQGLKVIFYISPQVWAWKENRVKKMKECIDLMLVILPFEQEYYRKKWNWKVNYVGHPLVNVIEKFREAFAANPASYSLLPRTGKGIIALLPGSRKQEILKKLPVMLEVSRHFPEYEFVVAKAPGMEDDFYIDMLKPYSNVHTVSNQTYALLSQSTAALVTSGTATLETALFEVPEVVCYKGNAVSYAIAKRIINIRFISLVNLIMDKEVVKELIQHDMNVENLRTELELLLKNQERISQVREDYRQLKSLHSKGGDASDNAANDILDFLKTATS